MSTIGRVTNIFIVSTISQDQLSENLAALMHEFKTQKPNDIFSLAFLLTFMQKKIFDYMKRVKKWQWLEMQNPKDW